MHFELMRMLGILPSLAYCKTFVRCGAPVLSMMFSLAASSSAVSSGVLCSVCMTQLQTPAAEIRCWI